MLDVLADGKVLMHWRARVYDPEHGRFLQRDPSGYVDGGNLYEAFCSNPLMCVDPSGLDNTKVGQAMRDRAEAAATTPFIGSLQSQAWYLAGGAVEYIAGAPEALAIGYLNLIASRKTPGDLSADALIVREQNYGRIMGDDFRVGRMLVRAPAVFTGMGTAATGIAGFDLGRGQGEFVHGWEERAGMVFAGAGQGMLTVAAPFAGGVRAGAMSTMEVGAGAEVMVPPMLAVRAPAAIIATETVAAGGRGAAQLRLPAAPVRAMLPAPTLGQRVRGAYQAAYNEAWEQTIAKFTRGEITIRDGLSWEQALGARTDLRANQLLRLWLRQEGITEGPAGQVLSGRWLRDPSGSGRHRVPDVRIDSERLILDGTISVKDLSSMQLREFNAFSGGYHIEIVRPQRGPLFGAP